MSLNSVVSAERVHIGFFGLRNAGKSSVVNAVTGQSLSLVSDIKGTTTDPVKKAMELLPLGPVVIIDTPGIDDEGTLGEMRVKRAKQILNQTDIAVLVVDGEKGLQPADEELISLFDGKAIPYIIAYNKSDLLNSVPEADENKIYVSAENGTNIYELKEMIASKAKTCENEKKLVADLISPNDLVVLVVPIDSAAPKGRLILPQQQVIRDVLESGACAVVCRETELKDTLAALGRKPKLVITDSQAFGKVSADTPADIPLTSFSILFVRYKSDLTAAVRGAAQLDKLKDGDRVLISEGCTHHRQCEDIGTVKMPAWVRGYTGKNIEFDFTSGTEFPENLSRYSLVIHCGACMLNPREMQSRARHAKDCGVPMTNYGVAIAQMHSILRRSIELFPEALKELDG
ncbi:MAG: [FeFe] hydrogenase H-cluster maturation GTPase HydF [Acutalibacteraceae bacterium]